MRGFRKCGETVSDEMKYVRRSERFGANESELSVSEQLARFWLGF
jgi:hypothetical protein